MKQKKLSMAGCVLSLAFTSWLLSQPPGGSQEPLSPSVTLTVTHEGPVTTRPPLDDNGTVCCDWGFYNVMTVSRGSDPVQGVQITHKMVSDPLPPTNNHANDPSGTWLDDGGDPTDANGQWKDLVQFANRNYAVNSGFHAYNWTTCTVDGQNLSKKYWHPKPYPDCTSANGHANQFLTVTW